MKNFKSEWFPSLIVFILLISLALMGIINEKYKLFLIVILPALFSVFHMLKNKINYFLFFIFIISVQFPLIEMKFQFVPTQIFITVFALYLIGTNRNSINSILKMDSFPYLLFLIGGFATVLFGGERFTFWFSTCVIPFSLLLVIGYVGEHDDIFKKILLMVIFSILLYLFFMWLSNQLGTAIDLSPNSAEWRKGSQKIILGPISITTWATNLGTLMAITLPLIFSFCINEKTNIREKIFYWVVLILFLYNLIAAATRGPLIATFSGMLLTFLLKSKKLNIKTMIIVICVILVLYFLSSVDFTFINLTKNIERLNTLQGGAISHIDNFEHRMDVLKITSRLILQYPLGVGHGYLWFKYGIDEVIVYSMLLTGTGIIGFVGFILIIISSILNLIRSYTWGNRAHESHDLSVIGLATILSGLLCGFSSESIVVDPINSFVFFTIILTCVCYKKRHPFSIPKTTKSAPLKV